MLVRVAQQRYGGFLGAGIGVYAITLILVVLGVLGTFPPVWGLR